MIEITELKENLGKFPDDCLVAAMEGDEFSVLAIFSKTRKEPSGIITILKEPEPIGYISTLGGLVVVYDPDDPSDQIGKELIIGGEVGEKI